MAKKRKFCAYRKLERPYTRYSKFKKKSFIRTRPTCRVVRFDMGTDHRTFAYVLDLKADASLQIRDNAIESARLTAYRLLEKKLTKTGFKLKIMIYPHHTLRENPLAAGAGADRMSTGMAHSFGKIIGIAAQVKKGKTLMRLWVDKEHLETARLALKRSQQKFPCTCKITVNEVVKKTVKSNTKNVKSISKSTSVPASA